MHPRVGFMLGWRAPVFLVYFSLIAAASVGCGLTRATRPMTVQVVDAETRQPLPGARVSICYPNMLDFTAPSAVAASTDDQGSVCLRAAAYGTITVDADRDGYRQIERTDVVTAAFVAGLPRKPSGRADCTLELWAAPRPAVTLVVPTGYHGPVKVVFETDESARPGQRAFTYHVGPEGRVVVRGPRFLGHSWEDIVARYADGTPVPQPSSESPGTTAFRWVDSRDLNGSSTCLYSIGTEADKRALWESVHQHDGQISWLADNKAYARLFAD